jgi:hypothetical protein
VFNGDFIIFHLFSFYLSPFAPQKLYGLTGVIVYLTVDCVILLRLDQAILCQMITP